MFCHRLSKGFNDAVNGFQDDGWILQSSDGIDDVTIMINSSPNKLLESHATSALYPSSRGILCAKASMLLQNMPPGLLVRFIREHRSEWVDYGVDAYSAASVRAGPYSVPRVGACNGLYAGQVMLPLCHTIENEEFLEVVRLESHGFNQKSVITRDMFLLQLCSGMDENLVNSCAQLVFAPIDEAFADDVHLLPSGFRVIPLESKMKMGKTTKRRKLTHIHHANHTYANHTINATIVEKIATSAIKGKYKLIDWSRKGEIVVEGRVSSTDPSVMVHFVPLGKNAIKVWVNNAIVPNACLWRPTTDLEVTDDALGTAIA